MTSPITYSSFTKKNMEKRTRLKKYCYFLPDVTIDRSSKESESVKLINMV